jgi:predicted phage-related endonuclease
MLASPGTLAHRSETWMLANVDRFADDGELAAVEIKLTRYGQGWAEHDMPERVEAQARWYLAVTGLDVCHVAVLIGGTQAQLRRVERSEQIERYLMERAAAFWQCVEQRDPPLPTGSKGERDALNRMLADDPPSVVELDEEWRERLQVRARIARELKLLSAADKQIRNQLRLALGGASEGYLDDQRVATWLPTRGQVSVKRLLAEHPELAALAETYRGEPSRALRFDDEIEEDA